jgi:RNA-directed DNA polymerase
MRRIEQEIEREAKRLILAQERRHRLHAEEQVRLRRRSLNPYQLAPSKPPPWWAVAPGFNPYTVRSRRRHVAHSVQSKLESLEYVPRRPVERRIPKLDGGDRPVNVYQVADSAVSKMIFESLLRKNLPMMSARSYAYRKDLTAQDAVRYIRSAFHARKRMYVAEYDFSKYFDNISHDHLAEVLEHFFVSSVERTVIDGFLTTPAAHADAYSQEGGTRRLKGIPQGTSISLFLANAAAWRMDRALEDHGVGFVRYADDTLIWSTDYGRLVGAVDILETHAQAMDVPINFVKSNGIRLLVADGVKSEIVPASSVEYLGYSIRLGSIGLKEANEKKIKRRVQQLIFETLLREPMAGTQDPARLAAHLDMDYAVAIARLKRYLYGDLSEREVRRYQSHGAPMRRFKGMMAAFPLLDDDRSLRALDAWLLSRLWLAMRKRQALLKTQLGVDELPPPHGLSPYELLGFKTVSAQTGQTIDLRVPSVRRVAQIVKPSGKRRL